MKFSAVVMSVVLAASQTSAFMAPVTRSAVNRPLYSSEMKEETAAVATTTTTEEEEAPGTIQHDTVESRTSIVSRREIA